MDWFFILLLICALALVLFVRGNRNTYQKLSEPPTWREVMVEDTDSTVKYRDRQGNLKVEQDGCNDCILNRAQELHRKGFVVEEVLVGRRNTGDLS